MVIDLDPAIANKFPLRIASGVLVAARAIESDVDVALEAGDVIHTIANSPVVLQIERSGKLLFIAFKIGEN